MKNLLIVGARGFGREVYTLATRCVGFNSSYQIKGFLDDHKDALVGLSGYPPIIDSVEDYNIQKNDVFIVALGDVRLKKIYTEKIILKKGQFTTLIHPTAIIGPNTKVGEGVIVGEYAVISCDITIGNHVIIHCFSDLGHDCIVGNYCSLGPYSFLGGYSHLEDLVTLHPRVSIMPRKKVKLGAIVGSGSVVMRNVPPNVTVHGNPARSIFTENENK